MVMGRVRSGQSTKAKLMMRLNYGVARNVCNTPVSGVIPDKICKDTVEKSALLLLAKCYSIPLFLNLLLAHPFVKIWDMQYFAPVSYGKILPETVLEVRFLGGNPFGKWHDELSEFWKFRNSLTVAIWREDTDNGNGPCNGNNAFNCNNTH